MSKSPAVSASLFDVFPEIVRQVDSVASLSRAPRIDLTKQFFMVSGIPVIPKPPRQLTSDISELYREADKVAKEFETAVQEYTRKADASGFVIVPRKEQSRTRKKAEVDYDGDTSRVCDILRATIKINSAAQYRKITNLLLPAHNSSIVRLQDGFASPDKDGGLRRVLANIQLSNGHIAEIQVRHTSMEKAFDDTDKLWKRIRDMRAVLENPEKKNLSNGQIEDLAKTLAHHEKERIKVFQAAAKKMDNVVIDRSFFLVDGFPVMQTYDRYAKEYSAVVPDARSGNFITDNRFLPLLNDKSHDVRSDLPRDAFIARCMAIVSNPGAKACLQVAKNIIE